MSPPNDAISIDFRPAKLQPELMRQTAVAYISFKGRYPMKTEDLQEKTIKMSLVMRKPAFCICENKDADQLRGKREADQRLCFCFTNSTIPLFPKSEISAL